MLPAQQRWSQELPFAALFEAMNVRKKPLQSLGERREGKRFGNGPIWAPGMRTALMAVIVPDVSRAINNNPLARSETSLMIQMCRVPYRTVL